MATIKPLPDGRLAGKRVGVLMENDFAEDEIAYYERRFAEEGARVELLTRLWGRDSLTFHGHGHRGTVHVTGDLEALDYHELSRLSALVVPAGMVADRLRYSEDVEREAPAVRLMRRAFGIPHLVKAFSCHGLLLLSAAKELVRGRPVTCHNNLVADVRNMGASYLDQDLVEDGDLITSRSAEHCHLLARTVIEALSRPRGAAA
ncbi:DJ-1/PfpI family protein [Streptomyces sp. NRRL S-118]|uniref:DJ-1/PfpI family protein n=1 Tax=Streptomyces sp. NRRL S-118 TaxID=1463881 RepID=UPI0004CC203D|nr:DJ-1/PfpI family protein [Streptomyces sp. NRRL S-118]